MSSVSTSEDRKGSGLGALLRVQIELWLVVVFMALAFGAGIVVTAMYDEPAEPAVGLTNTTGQIAPPLTDQQIAGGLPSGHPDLSGGATGATGAAGATGSAGSADGNGTGTNGNGT